jgi:hypothetical protein
MSTVPYSIDSTPRTQLHLPTVGFLYVLSVPLLAGISTARIDSLRIAGMNYTGFLWLFAMIVGLGLIGAKSLLPGRVTAFPILLWLPWVGMIWFSLVWTDSPGIEQVQTAMQLSMPVLVGAVAGAFIETRRELAQLIRAYYWTIPLLSLAATAWLAFDLSDDLQSVYVEARGLALSAVVIGGLALAGVGRSRASWWLWAACLAIPVVTGSRIATLALLVMPVINPVKPGLRRRAGMATCMGLVGLALIMTPAFQERFFGDERKGISHIASGDFDDAGRFHVWPLVVEEALKRPWFGHGVGTVPRWLPDIWARIEQPHNDYLRLLCEVGGVGLAIFLLTFGAQLSMAAKSVAHSRGVVRQAFAGASLGMIAFIIVACTDNPIGYTSLFMNPLFALLGAAYAAEQTP